MFVTISPPGGCFHELCFRGYQVQAWGITVSLAARMVLCVHFKPVVSLFLLTSFLASFRLATLNTGGWLALTRPGLAPGKKRQSSLGAITSDLFVPAFSRHFL